MAGTLTFPFDVVFDVLRSNIFLANSDGTAAPAGVMVGPIEYATASEGYEPAANVQPGKRVGDGRGGGARVPIWIANSGNAPSTLGLAAPLPAGYSLVLAADNTTPLNGYVMPAGGLSGQPTIKQFYLYIPYNAGAEAKGAVSVGFSGLSRIPTVVGYAPMRRGRS